MSTTSFSSERVFVDTAVGRLAVRTYGRGAPIVLWHSLFVDERSWQRVVPRLAADHRLVVITGPGHGESRDPAHRYTLSHCACAATQVLDALGVAEPVGWVGNAWGGHVGVRFATDYPGRIRSLVTVGSPIQPLDTAERMRTAALLVAHRVVGPAGFIVDGVVETMLAPATREHDPEAVALVRDCVSSADRRLLRNAVVSISLRREDLAALLPAIAVPTLMITGEQHEGWTPAQAEAAIKLVPDGCAAVVPDAAYLVPLEQPDRVMTLLHKFWAEAHAAVPISTRPTLPT